MGNFMRPALSRNILAFGPLVFAVGAVALPASAASFKADYYPDCYAPVSTAREMVAPPPVDVAGTAQKAGEVAGALGKLGGIPGLGGLGGLGGLAKAASTASQVATYSNYLSNAAEFTQKMQEDYPDPASRIAAYGSRMGEDADTVGEAAVKLDEAQACYETAFISLQEGVAAGEIKSRDAKRRQKEIQEGLELAGEVISDSEKTLDTNMKSYNEALTNDSTGMGLNLGDIASVASTGMSAASVVGANPLSSSTLRNANMYSAYQAQSNAYTSAWWDEYNRSGDSEAAAVAARATISGGSELRSYQQAYWSRQATAGVKAGQVGALAASPVSNLGALSALTQMGGMSGTGMAWVAANAAAGAASSAVSGGTDAAPAAAPSVAQTQAAVSNVGQTVSLLNATRGLSGGGGAIVGGNIAAGLLASAINSGGEGSTPAPAAAAPELTEAMQESLLNTSVYTSRFTDAYGLVSYQKQRQTELESVVSAKFD
jgi:hypothetical protein